METIVCPFCKERYQVRRVVEYKRFICGNCGRKHIYHNGRLVPFSMLRRKDANPRIEVCAYCKNDFTLEDDAQGEYICPFCNNILYILPPSGVMPGDSPDEAPHALDASNPSVDISRTAARPNTPNGNGASPTQYIEEPRRNIDIRRLPPPPSKNGLFADQPSSGVVPPKDFSGK